MMARQQYAQLLQDCCGLVRLGCGCLFSPAVALVVTYIYGRTAR